MILAIETSCDETGLAVVERTQAGISVVSQAVASQVNIHQLTGGVVPEVAAREHVSVFRPLLKKVLSEAGVKIADIQALVVTVGPGLQPALAVGVNAARTLSYALKKPLIPINHLEGHLYAALLKPTDDLKTWILPEHSFPALALIVSGGHTLLAKISNHLQYEILGETQDDAVGEAFDKVARLLGLPYPGGASLSKLAETGDATAFNFPRPMKTSGDLKFSFSGLKTAVLYAWQKSDKRDETKKNIAASFQQAVIDTLVYKVVQAIKQTHPAVLLVTGGVAANISLRKALENLATEKNVPLRCAPISLCGDNATMIGLAGIYALEKNRFIAWAEVEPVARLPLTSYSLPA